METNDLSAPEQPADLQTHPTHPRYDRRMLAIVALMSIVAGAIGGAFGSTSLLRSTTFQRMLGSTPGVSQNVKLTEDSAVIDVVQKASPAVVSIVISKDLSKVPGYSLNPFGDDPFFQFFYGGQAQQQQTTPNIQQVGAGSGFFVSADGVIVTNKHVVSDEQASYTVVTSDGKTYPAQVLSRDPVNDLAIVKIDIHNAPTLEFADSSNLQTGQRVIAIGNSLGQYQNTVTTGIVSGIGRSITAADRAGTESLEGVIQTDAAINPGNSGGPLLNTAAQVIGINTAIDQQGQSVGFAIAANDAKRALDSFTKSGKITRPQLGVRYMIITPDIAQQQKLPRDYGALVIRGQTANDVAVLPGSSADKAGIVENDIILELNGQRIDQDHTLAGALKNLQVGDTIKLKVFHADSEKEVTVTLGEAK